MINKHYLLQSRCRNPGTALLCVLPNLKHQMSEHRSYHGPLTGDEAEHILKQNTEPNCYLTRYSNNRQSYILSVINAEKKSFHFQLIIDNDVPSYEIQGTQKKHNSLDDLLKHLERTPLSPTIRYIGKPCLPPGQQQPIPQEQQKQPQERQQEEVSILQVLKQCHQTQDHLLGRMVEQQKIQQQQMVEQMQKQEKQQQEQQQQHHQSQKELFDRMDEQQKVKEQQMTEQRQAQERLQGQHHQVQKDLLDRLAHQQQLYGEQLVQQREALDRQQEERRQQLQELVDRSHCSLS